MSASASTHLLMNPAVGGTPTSANPARTIAANVHGIVRPIPAIARSRVEPALSITTPAAANSAPLMIAWLTTCRYAAVTPSAVARLRPAAMYPTCAMLDHASRYLKSDWKQATADATSIATQASTSPTSVIGIRPKTSAAPKTPNARRSSR